MFRKIMVPLDRSALAEQALGQAAAIARASKAGVDLVLVREPMLLPEHQIGTRDTEELHGYERYMQAVVAELHSGASIEVTHAVVEGAPAEMIQARAREIGADLIVMTSHGRTGLSRAWLGSVADAIVRRSAIPMLMLRPIDTPTDRLAARQLFRCVLVPTDGSESAAGILDAAVALAQSGDATVDLVRVVPHVPKVMTYDVHEPFAFPPMIPDTEATAQVVHEVTDQVETLARSLRERGGVKAEAHVVVGERVAESIIDFARGHDADVIAMSTRGRGASRLLLGSIADKLLRASGLPMLLRRPAEVGSDDSLESGDLAEHRPARASP
jgi:nucleotide-binding universal stress UspA family protein